MSKINSIQQVNFANKRIYTEGPTMSQNLIYHSAKILNKNQSVKVSLGTQQPDMDNAYSEKDLTIDLKQNVASKDNYLKMMSKNKDQIARKIVMGGGFDTQSISLQSTTQKVGNKKDQNAALGITRHSYTQLQPVIPTRNQQHKMQGSVQITQKNTLETESPYS